MHRLCAPAAALFIATALLAPLTALALGTSFGGRIIVETPCLTPTGPGFWVTIIPAGLFPVTYIWAPGTLGIPPTHPGQQILGVADVPDICTVGLLHFYGQRMQIDGVSPV